MRSVTHEAHATSISSIVLLVFEAVRETKAKGSVQFLQNEWMVGQTAWVLSNKEDEVVGVRFLVEEFMMETGVRS